LSRNQPAGSSVSFLSAKPDGHHGRSDMSILWIILIVVVVLALFGFIGRGFW
jgi:flagellar basal body-associated protein FliL